MFLGLEFHKLLTFFKKFCLKIFFRCEDLPKTNGVEPILVVFEDKAEKDQLWTKLSMKIVDDIVKKRSNIAITNVSWNRE